VDARLAAALAEFHVVIDQDARVLEAEDPRFVCPVPCAECCLGNVFFVTGLEFLGLCAHVVGHLPEQQVAEIVALAKTQVAVCGTEEALRLESSDGGNREPRIAQPCPLLRNDRCVAYAARPVPCRTFGRSRFVSGRHNLCHIIAGRMEPAGPAAPLPVVEDYSRVLARILSARLGAKGLARLERYVAVSTIPVLIAATGFDERLVADACTAIPGL
jgi:Fe-S-cluster containining protein